MLFLLGLLLWAGAVVVAFCQFVVLGSGVNALLFARGVVCVETIGLVVEP